MIHLGVSELCDLPFELAGLNQEYRARRVGSTACAGRDQVGRRKIALKIPSHAHKPAALEPNCRRIAVRP
jgi:hypothetical protein